MTQSSNLQAAIEAADQLFVRTFNQGDAAGVASLYTKDARFMPPNADFISGREAIQAVFQAFMDSGVKAVELECLEVEGYGDTASEVGRYTLQSQDGQVLDKGKFLVIWKNVDGQWKLHRDMINTSVPAPQ